MTSQLILESMKDGVLKIVVDAGHCLSTAGKRTPDDEREWSFNNKVLLSFVAYMSKYKNVQILRVDDPTGKIDIPLQTRTNKANEWKADIYISFHHNANTGKWGNWTGVETYVYSLKHPKSMELAKVVHEKYVQAMGIRDRGIKEANFHVIRETTMPAILLEGGYMDSAIDILKMRDDNVLNGAGIAIAQGITEHFNLQLIEVKPKIKEVSNKLKSELGVKQEAARQEAIRLGITDGNNPLGQINAHYVWSVMLPSAKKIEDLEDTIITFSRKIQELEDQIKKLSDK